MVLRQSVSHLLIGFWILAGLLVAGLNGYALMAFLDSPLSGYSDGIRAADRGMLKFRALLDADTRKTMSGMDRLAKRFSAVPAVADQPPATRNAVVPPAAKKRVTAAPVELPPLAGIITGRSPNGAVRRLALLGGTVFSEGDMLGELTVKGISARGVHLAGGGNHWFLKAPEISHSLTTR